MKAYASQSHYRDHLEPLGLDIADRLPADQSHVVVASRRDARKLETVRGCEVALVEHGAGQRYQMDAGGPDSDHPNVTLFLAPSQRVADQSAYLFPKAECVVVGSPRVEHLASVSREPKSVVLAFHWNSPVAPEARSAWHHYQTILPRLRDYSVLGHAHPAIASKLKPWYKRSQVEWQPSWADCVTQASVLVVDNSSIMWEACALGIPVVVLNAPWYRRDVAFGLRFWDYADIGPQVEHAKDLEAAIESVFTDDRWAERRQEAAGFVYDRIDGATESAVDAVKVWCNG